jgi:SAM-dependent methyltransferase
MSKWEINQNNTLSKEEREQYWENKHCNENYKTVWSMTDDKAVRQKIIDTLSNHINVSKILIPGSGSKVLLQNEIAHQYPDSFILCTDFKNVISIAEKQQNANNIKYEARDSANLGFDKEWDVVVIVNSILSESHTENREILASCYKALKPGGILVGFFPTIFAGVDIANLESNDQRILNYVDIKNSSFYEAKQNIWQIFYTPLRLRFLLRETGFINFRMEIFFCDSEYFINQSREYYGIDDPDLPIYEHFVIAHKKYAGKNSTPDFCKYTD